jgi:hypothetical protein
LRQSLLGRIRALAVLCHDLLSMSIALWLPTPQCRLITPCRRLHKSAEDEYLLPGHKFPELFDSNEQQYTIHSLEDKLNNAILVLSVNPLFHHGLTWISSRSSSD